MSFVCDFHVHLYPCYDLDAAFDSANSNLSSYKAQTKALCLTERSDCHFFRDLASGKLDSSLKRWRVESTADQSCLRLSSEEKAEIYLFAGRQVATSERIELLALLVDAEIPDRIPFERAKRMALEQGALPVLNWAMGKWMFARRPIVERIIATATATDLAVCDTTLRPRIWPEPTLMRRAREKGIPLLVGSDPLPFAGEESLIGSYGLRSELPFDAQAPVHSIRSLLMSANSPQTVGSRSGTSATIRRNLTLLHQR